MLAWNLNLFLANRLNGFSESLRFLLGLFLVCLPEFCVREYGPIRNFVRGHRLVSVKRVPFAFWIMVASFFTLFWIHRYFTCKFYFQVLIGSFTCSFMNVSSSGTQSSIRLSCCAAGKTRPIPISRPMPMSLDPDATLALVFQIQCWIYVVNQLTISLWSITTIRAVDTAFTMPSKSTS